MRGTSRILSSKKIVSIGLLLLFVLSLSLPMAQATSGRATTSVYYHTYNSGLSSTEPYETLEIYQASSMSSPLGTCGSSGSGSTSTSCGPHSATVGTTYRILGYSDDMLVWDDTYTTSSGQTRLNMRADTNEVMMTVRAYHSDGSTLLSGAAVEVETHNYNSVRTGTTQSNGEVSWMVWPTRSSGEHYDIIVCRPGTSCASSSHVVGTGNSQTLTNNKLFNIITNYNQPDMYVYSGNYNFRNSASPGDSFSVNWRSMNDGSGASSGTFTGKVYLSRDTSITTSDTEVCSTSISSISDGSNRQTYCTVNIPSSASGTYYWGVILDPSDNVDETDESNNKRAFGSISVSAINFDPTTSGSSFPSSGTTSQTVSVTSSIQNQEGTASGVNYRVYLSSDSYISTSDTVFCTDSINSVPGNSYATDTCSGTLPSSAGTYYWGVIADYADQIQETDESDNSQNMGSISVSVPQTRNLKPVSSGSSFPSSSYSGESETVTVSILNDGNTDSGSFAYKVYLSTDTYISQSDTLFCSKSHPSIPGGSSRTDTCSGSTPTSTGTYYWGVIVDTSSSISETSENDNTQYFNSISISDAPTINLVPTSSGSTFPSTGEPGDSVSVTTKILNEGNTASGYFTYKVYLSTDTSISTSDTLFCSKNMNSIQAGSSSTQSCSGTLPSSSRTYYWGVIADTGSDISETSENDNTQRFNSISISEAPTINLVPTSSGSTFPSTGEPGDSVSVTTKILNEGNTNSGSFTYKVYLSTDSYISESDTVFCTKTMNSIYAGSSRTQSCSGSLPSSSGNFYWGVIADTSSSISETSESDNSQTFNMISISEEPTINLVPTSSGSNFPSTGQTGDSVTVTTKILNEGNSASGSFTYKVYLSTDTYISASDTLFCSKSMNSISAGSSGTISCIASLPDSTGNYYWGVIADTDSEVSETSESDNTQRFNSISVSSGSEPDSDGDGVPDDNDNCPNTQSGAQVDSNGCESTSTDSDGDGVLDSEDDCPNTPSGDQVDSNGCTISSDDDLDIRLDIKGMANCDCISDGDYFITEEIRIPYAIANNGQDSISNVGLSIYAVQGSVMEFPGTGNLICDQTEFVDDEWVTGGTCTASFNSPGIYTFFAVLSAPEGTISGPSEVRMDWVKISTPVDDSSSTAGESESSNSVLPTLATIGFILLLLGGIAFAYTRRDELDWLPSFSGETSQQNSSPSYNMELSSYELPALPVNFNINQEANTNQAQTGLTPVYVDPNPAPVAQAPVYVDPNPAPVAQAPVHGDASAGVTKTQKIEALTEQHNAGTITDETYHALLMSILSS